MTAQLDSADFHRNAELILRNVETVIDGKPEAVQIALVTLLAEGHLLIEDVPGVGRAILRRHRSGHPQGRRTSTRR